MGMNAMILHVIGDMLGNVGVIATALIIWKTEWHYKFYADPAISLFIALIIFKSALPLTIGTAKVLLQATPDHIDVSDVREDIMALPGITNCHHFHVWRLSDTKVVASMHIQVGLPVTEAGGEKYMKLASEIKKCLHAYGIHSVTIQPEFCLDKTHDHGEDASLSMDGSSEPRRKCGRDDGDLCLLDDCCEGRGCCSVKGSVTTSVHSHQDEEHHNHEHDHGHAH
jgi:zinc transporter 1